MASKKKETPAKSKAKIQEVNRNPEHWDNIPEKLTPEQEKFRDGVYDEWFAKLTSSQDVDVDVLKEEFAWLYAWDNMPPPDVQVCDSPKAVIEEGRKYDSSITSTQWIGLSWDAPRVAFYDAHRRMNGPDGKPMLYHEIMEHVTRMANAGFWDGILFDGDTAEEAGLVIVSRRMTALSFDEKRVPHSTTGPCCSWKDGFAIYAYHGVQLEEKHVMRPDELTKEELMGERNSEVVRAVAEILGWEKFLKKIGTKEVDRFTDKTTAAGGETVTLNYRLFSMDAPKGRWERAPKFLQMQSPPLNDGTQPFYFEPVHPDLKSAAAARKWQIPKRIYPTTEWYTPQECNENPALAFVEEA